MSNRYFKKENVSNPIIGPDGKHVGYDMVIDNVGVVALGDDRAVLQEKFTKIIGRMGVSEITVAEFEEFKKKQPSPPRPQPSQKLRVFEPSKDPFKNPTPVTKVVDGTRVLVKPIPTLEEISAIIPAKPVVAPESVAPAVDSNPARPAKEAGESKHAFKPRKGVAKAKKHDVPPAT